MSCGGCGLLERDRFLLIELLKAATFHMSVSFFLWCEESWRDGEALQLCLFATPPPHCKKFCKNSIIFWKWKCIAFTTWQNIRADCKPFIPCIYAPWLHPQFQLMVESLLIDEGLYWCSLHVTLKAWSAARISSRGVLCWTGIVSSCTQSLCLWKTFAYKDRILIPCTVQTAPYCKVCITFYSSIQWQIRSHTSTGP